MCLYAHVYIAYVPVEVRRLPLFRSSELELQKAVSSHVAARIECRSCKSSLCH